LKLKCDVLLSNFAFKFNLRRYTAAPVTARTAVYGAGLQVGRCRLTRSNPSRKRLELIS